MNAMTKITAAATVAAPAIRFTGKGSEARLNAFHSIATLSFIEDGARAKTIAALQSVFGKSPTDAQIKAAAAEWVIGRVANRLVSVTDDAMARLDHARNVVLHYAMPSTAAKPGKLKPGQLGRRSEVEHKAVRAANEAWSMILAETGFGAAKTQKEKDKAKRSTNANPVRGSGKVSLAKGATPDHSELVKAPAPVDADEACNFLLSQSSTLNAFVNKHAKKLPTAYGAAVMAFRSAILAAENDRQLAKAEKEASK